MNNVLFQELVKDAIELWEPPDSKLIYDIAIEEYTVEHIIKNIEHYSIYRYFLINGIFQVSVDFENVNADKIIQYLAERLQ